MNRSLLCLFPLLPKMNLIEENGGVSYNLESTVRIFDLKYRDYYNLWFSWYFPLRYYVFHIYNFICGTTKITFI